MPSWEIRDRVSWRLLELYQRHLSLHDDEVVGYYGSGVGYDNPEVLEAEQNRFSICLATTDVEVLVAGAVIPSPPGRSCYPAAGGRALRLRRYRESGNPRAVGDSDPCAEALPSTRTRYNVSARAKR